MFVRSALRRHTTLPAMLVLAIFCLALLAPILDATAQGIRTNPTPTPTEEFDQGFAAQPTEEPTGEPERVPLTEAPDDPAPTEEPQLAAPSSLTLNKGACDDSNFDPYSATGLQSFLDACFSPDGEFEFTVSNDLTFNTTQSTELGTLFMQIPTGTITITETIPDGWGDPAVFCWSNLLPNPSDTPFIGNSPTWDVAEGEDVECWWFNIAETEPQGHTIRVEKRACAEEFAVPSDYWTLANGCQEQLEGIEFSLTTDGGTLDGVTDADGEIEWSGVDLGASGQVQIDEAIPDGYGEPVVWCVNFPVEAADAQDFDFFQVESTDGLIAAIPEQAAPFIFHCTFFNVAGSAGTPDDLTDPSQQEGGEGVEVTIVKHRCPLGVPEDTTLDQYIVICTDNFPDLQFTLEHAGGSFQAGTDENGEVAWINVPAGEIAIQEALTAQYLDPLAFCGIFAGEQELQFGQEPAPGGLVALTIPDEATNVTCWLFNIQDPDANNTIMVQKSICPPGTDTGSLDKNFYLSSCESTDHAGVNFTLTAPHGEYTEATDADGVIEWATVPLGDFSIQEEIPEGYGEPVVFCNFADVIQGIGFQNGPVSRIAAEGGLVEAAIEEPNAAYLCYYFNIPEAENSLTVNKWLCPVGFDKEADNPDADCVWPMDGVTFTLGDLEATTGDFLDGRAVFQDIPDGEHELTEVVPEGIASTFVGGCSLNGAPTAILFGATDPPTVMFEFGPGDHWVCEWYNVPTVESRVVVNKRICAADVDLILTDDNEINDIIIACPETGDGIEFTLDHAGGSSTQAIADGATFWDGVPHGPFTVTETIPPGYEEPVWYCATNIYDENGDLEVDTTSELANTPGGIFSDAIDEEFGEIVNCWVFNVVDPDSTTVTVIKWLCPAGFDVEIGDPVLECTEPMDNVNFTLNDLVATTGDAGPGIAFFEDVLPGEDYDLTEFLPGDTAYAFVTHCTQSGEPDLLPITDEMPPVVSLDIDAGDHWTCHWYNVPGGNNDIDIFKWLCPEDFNPNSSDEEYMNTCTEALDGIAFVATSDLGIAVLDTVGGTVGFGGFPAGTNVEIQEETPEEYDDSPYVICEYGDGDWGDVGAQAGVFEVYFAGSGETVVCHVFNFHGEDKLEDNEIDIWKWFCPEGTSPDQTLDWYGENCTEEHDGVDFKVTSDLGIAVQETSGGQVQFDGLPAGTAGIQETIPDGFGAPVVFCATENSLWQLYDASTGHWEYDFLDDGVSEILTCWVFNIPGEPPDLTILKWTCPEGYDLFAAGADPATDCTEATNGIEFELRFEGNPALQASQTTGDVLAGGVFFDDLEPDIYNAFELVPEGIASVFVLECTGHIMGVLQPYPLQFGPVLDDIDLDAGEHLVCHWYNVPDDEGGDLTLIKYTCSTEEFVSEVDCQVEEDGKTFDLFYWSGTWDLVGTETTDGFGRISWTGLEPGEYWFEEHDGTWCHIASDQLYEDGPWVVVPADQETIVHVYNCDGTPGDPGDTPTKYPNTGVPPQPATPVSSQGRRRPKSP